MRLSDDLFASIVGCTALQLEKKKGSERRQQGRVRLPARITVIPISKQGPAKPIVVQVRDLSQEGIGLLLPQKQAVGDQLLIRLTARETAVWIVCEVARVERVAPTLFVTGARFKNLVERNVAASA